MLHRVTPPTEQSKIICKILAVLGWLTFLQAIFLMFSHEVKMMTYFLSSLIYWYSITQLSYFGCVLNQVFNLSMIWFMLLEMAIKLNSGLYDIYLSSEGIYKMSSLVVSIVSLHFNFIGYQSFKQISDEIYREDNADDDL